MYIGTTSAASAQNLKIWMRNLIVKWSGVQCEVYNEINEAVDELFQNLFKQEQDEICHEIGCFKDWAAECQQAGVSCGNVFSIAAGG